MVADNPYQEDEDIYQLHDDEESDDTFEDDDVADIEEIPSEEDSNDSSQEEPKDPTATRNPMIKWGVYGVVFILVLGAGFIFYQQISSWLFGSQQKKETSLVQKSSLQTMSANALKVPTTHPKVIMPNQMTTPEATPSLKNQTSSTIDVGQNLHQATQKATEKVNTMNNQMLDLQKENQKLIESLRSQQFQNQMHVDTLTKQMGTLKSGLNELGGVIGKLTQEVQKIKDYKKL